MQFLATYLKLAPEFGGTEFGPYEELEVSLGSKQASCSIFIPPTFGVLPIHAKLIRKSPTDVILIPAERSAQIYLWKGRSRNPKQIFVPTAVKNGDSFALVSPKGPKFHIIFRELPPEVVKERQESIAKKKGLSGRGRLNKDAMAAEAKRQAWTSLLVTGPAQIAQRAFTFVKSGAIFQPRNIFIGLGIFGGWILAGSLSCRSNKIQSGMSERIDMEKRNVDECQRQNEALMPFKDGADFDFDNLVTLLISPKLTADLDDDTTIRNMVKEEAQNLFEEDYKDKKYSWVLGKNRGLTTEYSSWNKRVMVDKKLDMTSKKLLAWLPPIKDDRTQTFRKTLNSLEDDVCARGITSFTYRQARNLGLNVMPDGYFPGMESKIDKENLRIVELSKNVNKYNLDNSLLPSYFQELEEGQERTSPPETSYESGKKSNTFCIFQEGSDDRDSNAKVLSGIKKQFSHSDMNEASSISQIARIYSAELEGQNYSDRKSKSTDIKFKRNVGLSLKRSGLKGAEWAQKETARVIAQALVLPCMIKLSGNKDIKKRFFPEKNLEPNAVGCLALRWILTEESGDS